jgi:hypothetical protein
MQGLIVPSIPGTISRSSTPNFEEPPITPQGPCIKKRISPISLLAPPVDDIGFDKQWHVCRVYLRPSSTVPLRVHGRTEISLKSDSISALARQVSDDWIIEEAGLDGLGMLY